RGCIPGPHVPLSTLRRRPRERLRMTQGRCGSLLHIRMTLSFTTPRRFNRRTGEHSCISASAAAVSTQFRWLSSEDQLYCFPLYFLPFCALFCPRCLSPNSTRTLVFRLSRRKLAVSMTRLTSPTAIY